MNLPSPPDRWTIEIANAERINAISSFGFTERQARFLVNVLLHAGVFVERQYCAFTGIVHGQKSTDFIRLLLERRFATPITTGKLHRGRMFHVHYKPLWAAVGEPDNRFRKPAAPGRMIERVMLLGAVLDEPACTWLGPARDKRQHFVRHLESRLDAREYPHLTFGDGPEKTVRYFPDKLPIGVLPELDHHAFVYLQGAALRSARAYARPSGLDGACAQMVGRHLRDGRRMLLPSGTNGVLIDTLDGFEKNSRLFDRFRTCAFHSLVEVHFSRVCPLTSVARGASPFALTGAATHHPPLSVTDAEQPLIVALRASINSYPATSRETIGDAHADPQSPSVIQCTVGDREDSTTNYSVQVERFDSHRSLNRCETPSGSAPRSPMSVSGPHQRF